MRVSTPDIRWDNEVLVEEYIHALPHPSQHIFSRTAQSERQFSAAYLVEFPVPAVKHHLEGDVRSILNAWDPRPVRDDTNASGRARPLEIIDDQLVCTGRGVEVVEGFGGGRGGEQYTN